MLRVDNGLSLDVKLANAEALIELLDVLVDVIDDEVVVDAEADVDKLYSEDCDGADVELLLADIDPVEVRDTVEVNVLLELGVIVLDAVCEFVDLEELVEVFDTIAEAVTLELLLDDADVDGVDDPLIDVLPELLALCDGELLELTLKLELVDAEELYVSLGVKLLVADELLVTVSLGGGGVGSAECVLIAEDDLVIPKLLDELVEPVEDLDTEILRDPVELIELVLVVVIVEVEDPDREDVLLFVTLDVIVEDEDEVFE